MRIEDGSSVRKDEEEIFVFVFFVCVYVFNP